MANFETQFAQLIHMLDSAVFPGQPLKIFVVDEPPPPDRPQFAFAYDTTDPDKSFYLIYAGLESYFEIGRSFATHAMMEPDILLCAMINGILAFTTQEIFLGAALHEVRHRMQYCLNVPLFNQSHTDQVLRCRFWGEVQAEHYKNIPNGDHEFDAKFFECYGAHELRQGRLKLNAENLGNLLRMTVEQFLQKENKV